MLLPAIFISGLVVFFALRVAVGYSRIVTAIKRLDEEAAAQLPAQFSPVYVPEYGMLVTRSANDAQAYQGVTCNAWLGIGRVAATLVPQYLIKSVDD